jgi:hypothetical protein
VSYDVEGPDPVPKRSFTKPIRTAIVLALLAVAVVVAGQWGWTQLTQPFGDDASAEATPSCTLSPEQIAALPPPNRIAIRVYNASGDEGVATQTAEQLAAQGFEIVVVDNDPLGEQIDGVGEIRSAPNVPNRVDQLLRYVPGAEWVQDDRPGRRLDFAIGAAFGGITVPEPLPEGATENTEDDIPTC